MRLDGLAFQTFCIPQSKCEGRLLVSNILVLCSRGILIHGALRKNSLVDRLQLDKANLY